MSDGAAQHGKYVGRIGSLAFALGVGIAIATPAGIASAAPAASGSGGSTTTTAATATDSQQTPAATNAPEVVGHGKPSTARNSESRSHKSRHPNPTPHAADVSAPADADSVTSHPTPEPATADPVSVTQPDDPVPDSASTPATPDVTSTTSTTPSTSTLFVASPQPQPSPTVTTSPITSVVAPLLSSLFGSPQGGSPESPLAWVFFAAARRQLGVTKAATANSPTVAQTTSLTSTPAATPVAAATMTPAVTAAVTPVANAAVTPVANATMTPAATAAVTSSGPIVSPTIGTPNPTTGTVTGALNATDPAGQTLTYKVASAPSAGTLTVNSSTGTFTYTPTEAQRISAGASSSPVTVAMTVTVADTTNAVATTLNIPVSPLTVTNPTNVTVNGAHNVVATNSLGYVSNTAAGTVTVINTATDAVVGTIAVGASPDGLVLNPTGSRLYVSSSAGNTVTVVNTATNAVVKTITVTDPTAIAINSSGSTLYVANGSTGKVTKIATSTNAISGTAVTLPSGSHPTGLTVSPDKTHIYVTSTMADGSTGVTEFASSSTSATTMTDLPGTATGLVVSPDNSKLYVTTNNGTNSTITVINASSHAVIGSYAVPGVLAGIAVSNDGSTLVVNDNQGNVRTLNAASGATLSTTATSAGSTAQSPLPGLAVSPDATKLFVTNSGLNTVSVLTVTSAGTSTGQGSGTVGQSPTNVTVTVGNPTQAIGQVTGTVTATDPQGQALTYTVSTAATKGTVDINSATGTFTYVPTVASRYAAAAATGPTTDTFTVSVADTSGNATTKTVTVTVAPPSSSSSSIDQRSTTVAMNVQEMYYYTPAQVSAALALLKSDGITSIRMLVPWAGVEPSNGVYNWTPIDQIVNTANADGMQIDAVIDSTPSWALAGGVAISGEPNVTDFGTFASALATRYAGQISSYEIYNEVNAVTFWTPAPNAAQYTALLQAAYPAIKAADPNAEVIAAGLAPVTTFGNQTIDPVTFLKEMYADGAGGYFDAVAFHPYNYSTEFSAGKYSTSPIKQVAAMYAVMVANGDGAKEIWATEYGQPSSVVSEANQAAFIDNFLTTWRTLPYAGPAFIDTIQDFPSSSKTDSSLGVYRSDWSAKPAVAIIEEVIQQNEAIIASEASKAAAAAQSV